MLKEKRILAAIIDFYVIIYIYFLSLNLFNTISYFVLERFGSGIILLIFEFIILFILKDIVFKNASVGKKLTKIEILKYDGSKPNTFELLFRNIFLFITPIELILILFKNKRIGDMIFKTKVIFTDDKLKKV